MGMRWVALGLVLFGCSSSVYGLGTPGEDGGADAAPDVVRLAEDGGWTADAAPEADAPKEYGGKLGDYCGTGPTDPSCLDLQFTLDRIDPERDAECWLPTDPGTFGEHTCTFACGIGSHDDTCVALGGFCDWTRSRCFFDADAD